MKDLNKPLALTFLSIILLLSLFFRVVDLKMTHRRSPDEFNYTRSAYIVAHAGVLTGFHKITKFYINNAKMHNTPPPLRVAYVLLLSTVVQPTYGLSFLYGSYLSIFMSFLSMVVLGLIAWRYFNRWVSLYAVALYSFSPLILAVADRVWVDALIELYSLLCLLFVCECIKTKKFSFSSFILFALLAALSVLLKIYMIFFFFFLSVWLFVIFFRSSQVKQAWYILLSALLGGLFGVILLCVFLGGFDQLLGVLKVLYGSTVGNPYALHFQNGPWYRMIVSFWIMSPINTVLCFVGLLICLMPRRVYASLQLPGRSVLQGFAWMLVALTLVTMIKPYVINIRYLLPVYSAFFLLGGVALVSIVRALFQYLRSGLLRAVVIVAIVINLLLAILSGYLCYYKIFIVSGANDTSIGVLEQGLQYYKLKIAKESQQNEKQ